MFRRLPHIITSVKQTSLKNQYVTFHSTKTLFAAATDEPKVISQCAMILNGCGYLDGSDIQETISTQVALANLNYQITTYALDQTQEEVYDHFAKKLDKNEVRNVVSESSRMVKTSVQKLTKTKHTGYDFLVIPGGGGIGITMTDYAENGVKFTINQEVLKTIEDFMQAKKPIVFTSHAVLLAAKLKSGAKIVCGDDQQIIDLAKGLGASIQQGDTFVDTDNSFITIAGAANQFHGPDLIHKQIVEGCDLASKLCKKTGQGAKLVVDGTFIDNALKKAFGEEKYKEIMKEAAMGRSGPVVKGPQ